MELRKTAKQLTQYCQKFLWNLLQCHTPFMALKHFASDVFNCMPSNTMTTQRNHVGRIS